MGSAVTIEAWLRKCCRQRHVTRGTAWIVFLWAQRDCAAIARISCPFLLLIKHQQLLYTTQYFLHYLKPQHNTLNVNYNTQYLHLNSIEHDVNGIRNPEASLLTNQKGEQLFTKRSLKHHIASCSFTITMPAFSSLGELLTAGKFDPVYPRMTGSHYRKSNKKRFTTSSVL